MKWPLLLPILLVTFCSGFHDHVHHKLDSGVSALSGRQRLNLLNQVILRRWRRQSEDNNEPDLSNGSGDGEDYDDDDSEDTDYSPLDSSKNDDIIPTPVPKMAPASVAPATSSGKAKLIRPTKPESSEDAVRVEPTPVLIASRTQFEPRVIFEDYSNDTDPSITVDAFGEATATPTLDNLDIAIGPNLIEDDENEEKRPPSPPEVRVRLQRIATTAGKVFRFQVPADTFFDAVDGSAAKLHLDLVQSDGKSISDVSWLAFNSTTNEIYGLPLADDIGKYAFAVRARNSANLTAMELVEIIVRQHTSERAFNHRITLQLEPEFTEEEETFPPVYWLLKTVTGLRKALGDRDDHIVLRSMNGTVRNSGDFRITWTNETVEKTYCPEDKIRDIFAQLYNKDTDEVTNQLDQELMPQLSVTLALLDFDGICRQMPSTSSPTAVGGGRVDVPKGKPNTPPSLRNSLDHLDAQVGILFRSQVPQDTFHDEEDGETRMLKLSLNNFTNFPVDSRSWLQFDVQNQEFYGLPLDDNAGSEEFKLVATDSGGLTVSDTIVVDVKGRPKSAEQQPMVEFSLTLDTDYGALTGTAHRKVRLVETLAKVFNDPNPGNVVIRSFQPGSTIVTWSNATLVGTGECPNAEIERLRRILIDDDGRVNQRSQDILSADDFEPKSARITPLGICMGQLTPTYGPEVAEGDTSDRGDADGKSDETTWADDYLLTFIVPGIIITVMLLLAAVIACVLYRRRRTGKMGLEERRGFVSKGIPIIFAEELEERPSGRHPAKAPVILKDEKPAQPPPDYHKVRSSSSPYSGGGTYKSTAEHDDLLRTPSDELDDEPAAGLYQPPPPLSSAGRDSTSSSRYSRPKATPAYRKPPPYVPP